MENLITYTTRLIARNNCVIVPGMGAFLAHSVPASYNAADGIFMPPHRTLGFNPQVTVDDALLLSEYINEGQLTYEEAGRALRADIQSLRRALSAKGTVAFGEIGTFSMNVKSEISFTPAPNGIDDPYNFGFEPLAMPLLKDCEKKDIVIKRHKLRRYIAAAAAIILAFVFVAPLGDNAYAPSMHAGFAAKETKAKSTQQSTVAAAAVEDASEAIPAFEITPVADTVTESIITEEKAAETAKEQSADAVQTAVHPKAENAQSTYSIIVASTPNEAKAQLAIEELSSKMQAGYSVVEGSGRFRIALSSHGSNADANAALSQAKAIFPDAWILIH
ncbi:MAG: SPOR domain-containing protein [Bacteroidaceae bacterium]|nr:SPOR domain-containing protein [Bacteroidaceae bacterium]